ncbi:MAG: vWA domain-containing protein [Planctomycetota bacterium]|jgi:Mg-chelatase subunit ChlD
MKRNLWIALVLGVGWIGAGRIGAEEPEAPEKNRPCIEVVFVLDTTGSMGGLIEGAKRKIWSIANAIATGEPAPDLKIGLVAYRDRGDAYVTAVTPLTDDLDKVFKILTGFRAGGGGDGPEHVNLALHDAVHKGGWSAPESDILKIIFLVGDAPPHMDYAGDIRYPVTVEKALRHNIMVNTVQCGANGNCRHHWQEIARRGEGKYVAITQSGGMVAVSTPYDKPLADLESRIAATRVYFGTADVRKRAEKKAEEAEEGRRAASDMAPAAAADRAVVMAKKAGRTFGSVDLVSRVFEHKLDLAKVDLKQLPKALQGKSLEEIRAVLKEKWDARQALQKEMAELAGKRADHIKKELAKRGKADGFDAKVKEIIREKAKEAGIEYK